MGLAAEGIAIGLFARSSSQLDEVSAEIAAGGGTAIALTGDVTDEGAVRSAAKRTEEELGPVTLLVNNAGTCQAVGPLWEISQDEWWGEVAVHIRGAALCCQVMLPSMIARGEGRVINVYGDLGDSGGRYCSAYAVGKAGMLRLTDHLAAETADVGVKVFALHPGFVHTPMIDALSREPRSRKWLPQFSNLAQDRFLDPANTTRVALAIADGKLDRLSGRYVGAWEDIREIQRRSQEISDKDLRTLRLRDDTQ